MREDAGGARGGQSPLPILGDTLTRAGYSPHRPKGPRKCRYRSSPAHGEARRRPRPEGPGPLLLTAVSYPFSTGVTTATVARIERDEIEPRMTTLRKLAQGLEVDPADLVGE
jgi:hypothetical protein